MCCCVSFGAAMLMRFAFLGYMFSGSSGASCFLISVLGFVLGLGLLLNSWFSRFMVLLSAFGFAVFADSCDYLGLDFDVFGVGIAQAFTEFLIVESFLCAFTVFVDFSGLSGFTLGLLLC